jgi:type II secretory ATPase GspE/PulE/Tfp pilus assembly ATPase PilB-like protein
MNCEDCREILTAYLKGELDPGRQREVQDHLATCAACASESEGARKVMALVVRASTQAVSDLAEEILRGAIQPLCSDIHLQPQADHAVVRYRIDGVLHEVRRLELDVHQALVDCLKLMAGMSLAERGAPQVGRLHMSAEGKEYDFRVAVVPTTTGDSMVLRILPPAVPMFSLDHVGLVGEQRRQVEAMLHRPNGIVFVTGPTGSGKTTTLYAMLQHLNQPECHLMSVEDPVEFQFDGVTQIAVNRRAGLDFKAAMRQVLRQDPDIVMCGEIRDLETAELALQAAVTGHLVLSTLHTHDAVGVIRRLLDIGVEYFMMTSTLLGATAQRLARHVCPNCREQYTPTETEVAWLQESGAEEVPTRLWRGTGCDECRRTGYRHRIALYEVFTVDDELLAMMVRRAPIDEVEHAAAAEVTPMRHHAAQRVLAGETTAAEAMRVLAYLPQYD